MRVLLAPLGSSGDVNPFLGLGTALRDRGHEVIVVTNPHFEAAVARAGLAFVAQGTEEQFEATIGHPDMWNGRRGPDFFLEFCARCAPETYARLEALYEPGRTVCAAPPQSFGARVAQERLGLPLATVILNPMLLRSVHVLPRSPLLPSAARWFGPPGNRLVYWVLNRRFDRVLGPPVNGFRAGLGLAPTRDVFGTWRNSPQRIIGLWPDWLYGPLPDWPPRVEVTGFVEYDGTPTVGTDGDWRSAVDDLDGPPIVFTAGTAMTQAPAFFAAGAEACRRLGRPGILLSQRPEQVPDLSGTAVRHLSYAPMTDLLPRAAALVHHGGIGTAARALKAGIPQLVMPMAYDQHDNAHRLARLGVARRVEPRRFTPRRVARELESLLGSPAVADRCAHFAARMRDGDGSGRACELIEELKGWSDQRSAISDQ